MSSRLCALSAGCREPSMCVAGLSRWSVEASGNLRAESYCPCNGPERDGTGLWSSKSACGNQASTTWVRGQPRGTIPACPDRIPKWKERVAKVLCATTRCVEWHCPQCCAPRPPERRRIAYSHSVDQILSVAKQGRWGVFQSAADQAQAVDAELEVLAQSSQQVRRRQSVRGCQLRRDGIRSLTEADVLRRTVAPAPAG